MTPQSTGELPEIRIFKVQRIDNNVYESVTALKLAEGTRCIVFVAEDGQMSQATARSIAAEYDARVYPRITGVFGDYTAKGYDVDNNGKIILLLVDIKDGYTGEGGYVAGYFDRNHLHDGPSSNRADMLFIDINPQVPDSPGFYANIAHELQHLINYAVHDGESQELWLNEGLSSAAEYLYGGPQQDRIKYFKQDPLGTIVRGNNFFVWDGYWEKDEGDSLANYATAYLFFQWLRIHAGGPGIYSAIGNSSMRDYQAVTQAAKSWIPDITETDDSEIWNRLLSSWMIANLANAPEGLYGYKGEISTTVRSFTYENIHPVQFFPGEGIYSLFNNNKTLSESDIMGSGPHIRYVGIGGAAENPKIIEIAPYTGKVLLTYNANPVCVGDSETGILMTYSPALSSPGSTVFPGASRSALPSGGLPLSYPIGAGDLRFRASAGGAEPLR
ncbi:MAG: hypothetical protein LBG07_11700 [Treponema sp.]|nr:hypothetical protein [Treponema sp.]